MTLLQAQDLECLRGDTLLFRDLSFVLGEGEALYIEGPNGAGKTSLLRILAGLTLPETGEVIWRGEPLRRIRERFNAELIYIGHQPGIKAGLTVRENLLFSTTAADAAMTAAQRLGIANKLEDSVHTLSAGQRRRVALCRLLLQPGSMWILDEPYTALDVVGVSVVDGLIAEHLGTGGMVVLTSHQPPGVPDQALRRIRLGT